MPRKAVPAAPEGPTDAVPANELFKRLAGAIFWGSMILATGIHFSVFYLWPEMTAEVVSFTSEELTAIALPPEIRIPTAPDAIARPAVPVIATGVVDENITIAPTTFESNPVRELPPPPTFTETTTSDLAEAPTFTPYTVRPDITNRAEVQATLELSYPTLLKEAGLGGTVQVWFFIDKEGTVVRTLIHETSGHEALDEAAMKVADVVRFTPALNRDKRVPVWISLPITFRTR
jgi:protein TonB